MALWDQLLGHGGTPRRAAPRAAGRPPLPAGASWDDRPHRPLVVGALGAGVRRKLWSGQAERRVRIAWDDEGKGKR
jgi:hypothetical protein